MFRFLLYRSLMFCHVCYILRFYRLLLVIVVVFFFKQKTAYEMPISDWISDVCSSAWVSGVDVSGSSQTQKHLPRRPMFIKSRRQSNPGTSAPGFEAGGPWIASSLRSSQRRSGG